MPGPISATEQYIDSRTWQQMVRRVSLISFVISLSTTNRYTTIQPRLSYPTANTSRTKFSISYQAPKPRITSKSVSPFSSLDCYTPVRVGTAVPSVSPCSKPSPSSLKTWSSPTLKGQVLSIASALLHFSAMPGFGVGWAFHSHSHGIARSIQLCPIQGGASAF